MDEAEKDTRLRSTKLLSTQREKRYAQRAQQKLPIQITYCFRRKTNLFVRQFILFMLRLFRYCLNNEHGIGPVNTIHCISTDGFENNNYYFVSIGMAASVHLRQKCINFFIDWHRSSVNYEIKSSACKLCRLPIATHCPSIIDDSEQAFHSQSENRIDLRSSA